MPRLQAETREERRGELLAAAWRCASRRGYRDLTVDDVCVEAGVSKGAFYGYFASKQALLVALLEQDAGELDAVLAGLDQRERSPRARLRLFAQAMLRRGEDPARVQVRSDMWVAVLGEPGVRESVTATTRRRRATLRRWVEEAISNHELVELPSNALASLLLALGDGLMLHGALDPSGFRWPNIARALDALLAGLDAPIEQR